MAETDYCVHCGHDVNWHEDLDGDTHECNHPNCYCQQFNEKP